MATKLALWFLPFLLFFLMNGHGISSRDLKVELQDHTDTNSQAYLTGYNTEKEADSQAYLTGYNSQKEVNPQAYLTGYNSQKEVNPQAYLTGYNTEKKADSQAYLTGYNSQKEVNPQAYLTGYNTKKKADSQTYLTGYNTHKDEYLTGYIATSDNTQSNYKTSKKHNHPSHHANNVKNHPSHSHHANLNQPYITTYETSNAHDANKPNYLIGYRTSTHAPGKDITGYTTTPRDQKESRYGIDTPYITQYGGGDGFKEDSDTPYIAQYGDAKKGPKESRYGTDEPYITGYGADVAPKRDSNAPYIAQYGVGGSNKEIKKSATAQDSAKPNFTNYGLHSKKAQGLKGGPPSSNVDHTEAFKVGFFAMDDLYIGNIMTLQFPVEDFSHFLSKKEADSIPFSIPQLPSVLQLFSISEDSAQAKSMRGTIEQCEAGTITGETKICANSLESMLEFVHNIIGSEEKHNIHTTSPSSGAPLQEYTILKISEDIYAPKWVACHPLPYPYGVYYCHFISTGTRVFKVLLDGENGDKVEALGVCHLDTSDWSPNHILFKQLGFMPGEAPVYHFFPVKHLMWVPQPSTATV
ncbi:Protein RAFTIN 1A [Arachis hypogaea]|nr:Protein RAFTIN 1A [Arachis hypogaea]